MKRKELILLTARDKFFGQTRKPWTSLDVSKIVRLLEENGFTTHVFEFHEIINKQITLENKTILYAFSQKENYRQYIKDIMYHLSKKNDIIPSYDLLLCHENKGYQEIYSKEIGLKSLWAEYYTSGEEIDAHSLPYPVVVKTTQGSNGKGVYMVNDETAFENIMKRLRNKRSLFKELDLVRRKYLRKKKFREYPDFSDRKDYYEYKEYIKVEQNFVIQEFVPDLNYDYRVLIAFDRFYVMKREIKEGDFRASGSKMFSFNFTPNQPLLDFSQSIYDKFNAPFLSIDVLYDGKKHFLAEYQALHFGMAVLAKSKGYFIYTKPGIWEFIKEKPDLEKVFAETLGSYLYSKNIP